MLEIVARNVYWLTFLQLADVANKKLEIEVLWMIKIDLACISIWIICRPKILIHTKDKNIFLTNCLSDFVSQMGLARAGASGDSDDEWAICKVFHVPT